MRLAIRSIGNSLGVIIPKAKLREWGLDKGDTLELSERSIRPPLQRSDSKQALDELKRRLAVAVTARCTASQIRAQGLANLYRWKQCGSWISAYDEWQLLLESSDDGLLFATMLGRDERATRLRQSAPYVGLLPPDEVQRLNEEAGYRPQPIDGSTKPLPRRAPLRVSRKEPASGVLSAPGSQRNRK